MKSSPDVVAARTLWQYLRLDEPTGPADVLLVLGSIDDRVAEYAAKLSQTHDYGHILFSGGIAHANDLLATHWNELTEAEHFLHVYESCGGRMIGVLLEKAAQHTGENASLSYKLLQTQGLSLPKSIQLVTKPYMERRARATFEAQWPDRHVSLRVSSPPIAFEDYFTSDQPYEKIVTIMVGDYQRIRHYARLGLQTSQPHNAAAEAAFRRLVDAGYTTQLIKNTT